MKACDLRKRVYCEHTQLRRSTARSRKSTRLTTGAQHAMTRHNDRKRILSQRLTDVACKLNAAQAFGDIAIGESRSRRNSARDLVDAAVEIRYARRIENDIGKICRFTIHQRGDGVDGLTNSETAAQTVRRGAGCDAGLLRFNLGMLQRNPVGFSGGQNCRPPQQALNWSPRQWRPAARRVQDWRQPAG